MIIQLQSENNRKKLSISLKAFFLFLIIFILTIFVILLTMKPKDLILSNIDLTKINDGIYTGSADNGLVNARVSVEIKDSIIQNITILKHDNLFGKPAEKIVDDIIKKQSLRVDTITSATYSSTTILKAIDNALIHEAKE